MMPRLTSGKLRNRRGALRFRSRHATFAINRRNGTRCSAEPSSSWPGTSSSPRASPTSASLHELSGSIGLRNSSPGRVVGAKDGPSGRQPLSRAREQRVMSQLESGNDNFGRQASRCLLVDLPAKRSQQVECSFCRIVQSTAHVARGRAQSTWQRPLRRPGRGSGRGQAGGQGRRRRNFVSRISSADNLGCATRPQLAANDEKLAASNGYHDAPEPSGR